MKVFFLYLMKRRKRSSSISPLGKKGYGEKGRGEEVVSTKKRKREEIEERG